MALTPGTRLGPYEVTALLGAGGMGEVYRARDTKLNRDVALKVLPDSFANDPDRLARFQREAQVLASLNHPNIAHIHGLEDSRGVRALVMELVEGEDLAQRLTRGAIAIDEALPIAKQIAEALEAAHEQGIIHRDLKPANIKVRPDGTVKVLDFGLAKAMDPLSSSPNVSQSPTITTPAMTQAGMILGTAAYMSPEQARGQAVDKRTDIWAFGCVLFEMLSGRPAFRTHTLPDTIAAVLEREPSWVALPERTPPGIRRLLQRCLQKDAKWRLRDIGDARIEIAAALGPERVESTKERDAPWYRRYEVGFVALAGTLAMIATALGWAWVYHSGSAVELKTLRLQVNPPEGTQFVPDSGSAIAPDGSLIAFVAQRSGVTTLWVRPLNGITARELPGTQGANFPFWSPDSRSLGFFASGKLKRIDVTGAGLPGAICDVQLGRGGSWNADGTILFNYTNDGPLMRVTASGGSPTAQTTVNTAKLENSHRWPQFLPGGRRFLYFVRASNPAVEGIYVGSLDRQEEQILVVNTQSSGIYARGGSDGADYLLWIRDGALTAQQFDLRRAQLKGDPVSLGEPVAFNTSGSRLMDLSVSSNGTLSYGTVRKPLYQLTWLDRKGGQVGIVGQPDWYESPRISPDDKRVIVTRLEPPGGGNVWQIELARGIPTRLTVDGGVGAVWAPDGQRISYTMSIRGSGPPNIFVLSANGQGPKQALTDSQDSHEVWDWSLDGRYVLYSETANELSSQNRSDLWVLSLADRKPAEVLRTRFEETRAQFSPDGKWIAFTSDESGRAEVYVQPFPANGRKWPVSSKGGDYVRWRRDGRELFFIAADGMLVAVPLSLVNSSPEFGAPIVLFKMPGSPFDGVYPFDVAGDGDRFLTLAPVGSADVPPRVLVINWTQELKARVPTK